MKPGVLHHALRAARRRWSQRRYFTGVKDWFLTLYDTALRFIKRIPMPGRSRAVAVRLRNDPEAIYLRLGRSDGFVMEEIFIADVYAPVTLEALGKAETIVDLGANVGLSVRLWQRRFPEARIVAVEPDPDNFTAAERNLAKDPHRRVQMFRALIGDSPGQAYLDRSAEECAFSMTDSPIGEPIDVLPLPTILDLAKFDGDIDLLKVDIEGAEQKLFADCSSWISRIRALMIELHPNYSKEMLLADLSRAGANFTIHWENQTAGNPLLFLTQRADR